MRYHELRRDAPEKYDFAAWQLNSMGYELLRKGDTCGWRIVISPTTGHLTLLHPVDGSPRVAQVVADFKGIRDGWHFRQGQVPRARVLRQRPPFEVRGSRSVHGTNRHRRLTVSQVAMNLHLSFFVSTCTKPIIFWALAQIRPISCEMRIFPNPQKLPQHPSELPVVWERSIRKAEILSTPVSARSRRLDVRIQSSSVLCCQPVMRVPQHAILAKDFRPALRRAQKRRIGVA